MPRRKTKPKGPTEAVVHEVAGSFDQRGQVACILCGRILLDYSDAQIEFDGTRTKGAEPERPLPPGPVTVTRLAGSNEGGTVKVGALFGAKRCTELSPLAGQDRAGLCDPEPSGLGDRVSEQPAMVTSRVICMHCDHKWVAKRSEGTKELECPKCHHPTYVEEWPL